MIISTLNSRGYASLSDVKDLVLRNAAVNQRNHLTIYTGERVLLDNYYYGSPDNEIHLDLRELVLSNTFMLFPGYYSNGDVAMLGPDDDYWWTHTDACLPLRITLSNQQSSSVREYSFTVYPFEVYPKGASSGGFFPAIDELRIPKDYLLPISTYMIGPVADTRRVTISVIQDNKTKSTAIDYDDPISTPGYMISRLATIEQMVEDGLIEMDKGPFQMYVTYTAMNHSYTVFSPILRVVNQRMEQYAFLSPEGIYYNIPMGGKLWFKPEYDISVLRGAESFETASAGMSDLHEQNSGPLTRRAALALASYMVSRDVWHYDRDVDTWRRIVIESPSVNIANTGGAYSLTFQWRYTDNDGLNFQ